MSPSKAIWSALLRPEACSNLPSDKQSIEDQELSLKVLNDPMLATAIDELWKESTGSFSLLEKVAGGNTRGKLSSSLYRRKRRIAQSLEDEEDSPEEPMPEPPSPPSPPSDQACTPPLSRRRNSRCAPLTFIAEVLKLNDDLTKKDIWTDVEAVSKASGIKWKRCERSKSRPTEERKRGLEQQQFDSILSLAGDGQENQDASEQKNQRETFEHTGIPSKHVEKVQAEKDTLVGQNIHRAGNLITERLRVPKERRRANKLVGNNSGSHEGSKPVLRARRNSIDSDDGERRGVGSSVDSLPVRASRRGSTGSHGREGTASARSSAGSARGSVDPARSTDLLDLNDLPANLTGLSDEGNKTPTQEQYAAWRGSELEKKWREEFQKEYIHGDTERTQGPGEGSGNEQPQGKVYQTCRVCYQWHVKHLAPYWYWPKPSKTTNVQWKSVNILSQALELSANLDANESLEERTYDSFPSTSPSVPHSQPVPKVEVCPPKRPTGKRPSSGAAPKLLTSQRCAKRKQRLAPGLDLQNSHPTSKTEQEAIKDRSGDASGRPKAFSHNSVIPRGVKGIQMLRNAIQGEDRPRAKTVIGLLGRPSQKQGRVVPVSNVDANNVFGDWDMGPSGSQNRPRLGGSSRAVAITRRHSSGPPTCLSGISGLLKG